MQVDIIPDIELWISERSEKRDIICDSCLLTARRVCGGGVEQAQ